MIQEQKKCQNCNHLYFQHLKVIDGQFCSLDCKTSYNYMQEYIQSRINKLVEEYSIDFSESSIDFSEYSINFSESSLAYELDKSLYSKNQIKSIPNMYDTKKTITSNNIYNSL